MKNLNPKLVKLLSDKLNVSEKTVKNNIFALSKDYPHSTSNARAQVYARKQGLNVYNFLDKEDKHTLPGVSEYRTTQNTQVKSSLKKRVKVNKIEIKNPNKLVLLTNWIVKLWNNISNPQKFIGALLLILIAFLLPRIFPDTSMNKFDIPQTTPELTYKSPLPQPIKTQDDGGQKYISSGNSYSDSISGLTVGVNRVLPRSNSELTITFPGKSSDHFNDIKSGRKFYFTGFDNLNYEMTVVEIGFDSIKIKIDKIISSTRN